MILDYEVLKLIWWVIIGVVLIAFAITGGSDIGANILLFLLGKNDDERRLIINSIGPTWEGNQVWLVTFGGALFAVWPQVYATAFSSLYFAMFLALLMLILRPPGIDYRSKLANPSWRNSWDICLFVGSFVLSLVFGVAIGNLFTGLPFHFDADMRPIYTGSFISLFTPLTLLFGITAFAMLTTQGALFLQYKLEHSLYKRAKTAVLIFAAGYIFCFIACGACLYLMQPEYFANYSDHQILWLLPIASMVFAKMAIVFSQNKKPLLGLLSNSLAIITGITTAATALFPYILKSTTSPEQSLTIWNATSSHKTLEIALLAVLILLPIVLTYTIWVYRVMRGKVVLQENSY